MTGCRPAPFRDLELVFRILRRNPSPHSPAAVAGTSFVLSRPRHREAQATAPGSARAASCCVERRHLLESLHSGPWDEQLSRSPQARRSFPTSRFVSPPSGVVQDSNLVVDRSASAKGRSHWNSVGSFAEGSDDSEEEGAWDLGRSDPPSVGLGLDDVFCASKRQAGQGRRQ